MPSADTRTLIFERTKSHILDSNLNDLYFTVKSEFPIATTLSVPNIYWGTYFRICAILTNGDRIYSSTYSINDYIEQKDFDSLLNASSIYDPTIDNVSLHIINKSLIISAPFILSISIYDLYGNFIYNGNVGQTTVIPLDKVSSPFVIVTYKTKDATKTTKILIQ